MKKALLKLYYPEQFSFPEEACCWYKIADRTWYRSCRTGPVLFSEYTLPAGKWGVSGKRLLFLSDFHWHGSPRNEQVLKAVQQIAGETSPELLLLGGDLVGDASHIGLLDELLPRLRPLAAAVVAVTGNWECGKRWLPLPFWQELYQKHDIRLLLNETCEEGAFFICGTTTLNSREVRLMFSPREEKGRFPVLLSHAPDTVIALNAMGKGVSDFPLILCGHTHGGQWRLPWCGALYIPSRYGRRFDRGLFQRENTSCRMLVSSGLGELSLKGRFFCPPEAVLIRFR